MRDLTKLRHLGTRQALMAVGVGLLLFTVSYVPRVTAAEPVPSGEVENTALPQGEMQEQTIVDEATGATGEATTITSVDVQPGQAVVSADGKIGKYRLFSLADPSRLVVDLYGVRPEFKERQFSINDGFNQVRVGTYADRTRFVFDSLTGDLPAYTLKEMPQGLQVNWDTEEAPPVQMVQTGVKKVSVEEINFQKDEGKTQLVIELSAPGEIIPAQAQGNIVHFGVKNADIHRAMRRTFDSSGFPSAVLRITPYTAMSGDRQDVFFAVQLKGQVPFQLLDEGKRVVFLVEDGNFAEPAVVKMQQLAVPVDETEPAVMDTTVSAEDASEMVVSSGRSIGGDDNKQAYVGEKVRLEFDDADLRDIFRMIGDVSDLNIIVSDEVKGSVTLRLIDVPWDQALDLILEINNLGMLKEGNVVRILPKDQIRSMEESKFTAARNKEKLEDLVTEVIPVSYTDLKNVESPSKELLTERGKITPDNRNKQLIVTDIPSVIASIKKLIEILDTPERQVMIEARIVEADSTFNRNLGVNWGLFYAANLSRAGFNPLASNLGFGGNFVIPPGPASAAEVAGVGANIEFGKFGSDTTVLDLRLSAMESEGNGKIISRPRVTTLNGEKAKISQGTMIPYQTVSNTEITTELVEAALSLEVTPVINPDNSIILEIKATNSSPGTTVATGAGAAPSIDSKEAETRVLVRDGETTVIGGIFVENNDFAENGVPLLRNIPILGNFFKSTQKTNSRSELLVFITPRILK